MDRVPSDLQPSGERLALVIGTGTYSDPGFGLLRSPAKDVADVAEVLGNPRIGHFSVTQLVDRPEYEIRRSIGTFLTRPSLEDLVVVYLSCHGVLDHRGRLFFAATDTDKDQLSATAVESAWLLERLEDCRARRQVLILDCCFSGAFAHSKAEAELNLKSRLVGRGRGRVVLTSSRSSEYSFEGVPLDDAPTGSIFTSALVGGLRSGAADHDGTGFITVDDIYDYVADQVVTQGAGQRPQRWVAGGEGAIVLAHNPSAAAVSAPQPVTDPWSDALRRVKDPPGRSGRKQWPGWERGSPRRTPTAPRSRSEPCARWLRRMFRR